MPSNACVVCRVLGIAVAGIVRKSMPWSRQFTQSKVMAWVALDRAVKSEKFHLQGPVARWRKLREQIHAEVCERGYNTRLGAFVQSYGTTDLVLSRLSASCRRTTHACAPRWRRSGGT
jgi:hypothetical protein